MTSITMDCFTTTTNSFEGISISQGLGKKFLKIPTFIKVSTISKNQVNPVSTEIWSPADIATIDANVNNAIQEIKSSFFIDAIQEVQRYSSFPENWDGYKGAVFSKEIVSIARDILGLFENYFNAYNLSLEKVTPGPCSDGSIDIELVSNAKTIIISISSDLKFISIFRESLKDEKFSSENKFKVEEAPLEEYLHWISGKNMVSFKVD